MNVQRADVLMVNFPFHDTDHSKPRPAVVIQADMDNQRLGTTIVAMITKSTRLANREPRHVLIDIATPDGQASGLWINSVVNCSQLVVVGEERILRHMGHLPAPLMQRVSDSLRQGLGL
ncbi:MAG: type II toxin-antitoxin system PemK/MazF family toxin [Planctomycetaceae bacterium]